MWENYYHLVNPCFIILLLLHGESIRQAGEHLALQVESGEKGSKKKQKRPAMGSFDVIISVNWSFWYLNSEKVRVGVDLWVATIGQIEY